MALIPAANKEEEEEVSSLLRRGEQYTVLFIFTQHHTHFIQFDKAAILVRLFWRLPPEIHI